MYLTAQEYIDRYGEAETTRLTDETRSGEYDSEKLDEALSDSEEEVNAYLGKRYTIPLTTVPRLVQSFVAALARERLHRSVKNPAVTDEAERARAQLRDISRGIMTLPDATGIVTEDARAPADSESSNDGLSPIFSEENLAGFGVPAGTYNPNWKA